MSKQQDEHGVYVRPVCPKCGEAELVAVGIRSERVLVGIDRLYGDWSHSSFDIGPDNGHPDYFDDVDTDEFDEVFCHRCEHRMTWDEVYEQVPEDDEEAA